MYSDFSAGNVTNQTKQCDTQKMENQCDENERCFQNSKGEKAYCKCKIGYDLEKGRCVQVTITTVASVTDQPNVMANSGGIYTQYNYKYYRVSVYINHPKSLFVFTIYRN